MDREVRMHEQERVPVGETRMIRLDRGTLEFQNDLEVPLEVIVSDDTQGVYVGVRRASIFERSEDARGR